VVISVGGDDEEELEVNKHVIVSCGTPTSAVGALSLHTPNSGHEGRLQTPTSGLQTPTSGLHTPNNCGDGSVDMIDTSTEDSPFLQYHRPNTSTALRMTGRVTATMGRLASAALENSVGGHTKSTTTSTARKRITQPVT